MECGIHCVQLMTIVPYLACQSTGARKVAPEYNPTLALQLLGFYLCPHRESTNFFLGKQGLSLHNTSSHTGQPLPSRPANFAMINDAFHPEDEEAWQNTLHWSHNIELPPPPHRNSIWSKLNCEVRKEVLDNFLQIISILHKAMLTSAPENDSEEMNGIFRETNLAREVDLWHCLFLISS